MGPTWASVGVAASGNTGTRANWALTANKPVSEPGMRTEPPPSVPSANGVTPAATLAAAPALEPPGVFDRSQGLRVMPVSGLSPTALQPNSLVVVFPTMTPPSVRTRSTDGASTAAVFSAASLEPNVHRTPSIAIRSLTEIGSPCSRPGGSLSRIAFSAFRAAARATSSVTVTKAFSFGSTSSIRARHRSSSSTGEISFATTRSRSSTALLQSRSVSIDFSFPSPGRFDAAYAFTDRPSTKRCAHPDPASVRARRKSATVWTTIPNVSSGLFMKAPKSFMSPVSRWVASQSTAA